MKRFLQSPVSGSDDRSELLYQKARFFIRLRWIAILVAIVLSYVSTRGLQILPVSNFQPLAVLFITLSAVNILFLMLLQQRWIPFRTQIVLQVVVDLVVITVALHFSGGVENPLFMFYFLHLMIASILLDTRVAYAIAGLCCVLFCTMVFGEYGGVIAHYDLHQYGGTATIGDSTVEASNPYSLFYGSGTSVAFSTMAFMLVYLTTLAVKRLRDSEREARQKAEDLATEKKKLESVLDGSGMGYMLFDDQFRLKWCDERVKNWFADQQFLEGERCSFVHSEPMRDQIRTGSFSPDQLSEKKANTTNQNYLVNTERIRGDLRTQIIRERRYECQDGDEHFLQFMTYPLYDDEGNLEQVVELINDVTEKKMLEKQARHEDRMAKLGQMASGIAHEIGNPLSSIRARLQRLERKFDEAFIQETAEFIDTEIGRLNRLIRDISSFARAPEPNTERCRLEEMIEETVNLLSLDPRSSNVEIERQIDDDLPPFQASRDQLSQVFLNLGLNALDAMQEQEDGRLNISAEHQDDEVEVAFSDNGEGIPEDLQYEIFTPYFSTKDREEGTGLGLSIAHSLVEAHNGSIEVESEPGEGTTFTVRIPFVQSEEATRQISSPKTGSQMAGSASEEQNESIS